MHRELGPEYSDAVVAAFLDKVDREVAARVEARLADRHRGRAARLSDRRMFVKGVAIGACAGALITGVSLAQLGHTIQVGTDPVPGVLKGGPGRCLPDGRGPPLTCRPGADPARSSGDQSSPDYRHQGRRRIAASVLAGPISSAECEPRCVRWSLTHSASGW